MMDKEPTLEETKKLWEWCGFRWVSTRHYVHNCMMHGGNYYEGWWEPPLQENDKYLQLPPIDLNNLFKFAVPQTINKIMQQQECSNDIALSVLFKKWFQKLECDIPNYEGTLFRVIREVIDEH